MRFDGRELAVPARYEIHWRRFETIPTDLVREAAYAVSAFTKPAMRESDRVASAEVFVRDHVLAGR